MAMGGDEVSPLFPLYGIVLLLCCVFATFIDGCEWLLGVSSFVLYLLVMEVK